MAVFSPAVVSAFEPDHIRILAIGDSLTAGYGLSRGEGFPAQLQDRLQQTGIKAEVVDGGVSGDTTAGGLARLDWTLAGGRVDAVIVELGANDGLRGIDPSTTFANLDAILAKLKGRGLPVLLTGMLAPPNLGADYAREFEAIFPRLAERHGVALYPFFLEGVAAIPDLNQADGIHPTAEGVGVIASNILPYVLGLISPP